jgi:hypothetical protein
LVDCGYLDSAVTGVVDTDPFTFVIFESDIIR